MEHIKQHKALLARPDVRDNDELAALVLGHIQEHVELATNADPALLALTGQRIPDLVMEEAMAHQVEKGAAPGQNAPKGPPGPGQAGPPGPPPPGMAGEVPLPGYVPGGANLAGEAPPGLPRLPVDPLSGQRVPA